MRMPRRALPILVFLALAATTRAQPARSEAPDQMERANRAAAILVLESLRKESPDDHRRLVFAPPTAVLVIRGRYDHVEWVLARTGVRYRAIHAAQVDREDLRSVRLILIDCPGELNRRARERLKSFVDGGGHLLTTDWAATHVLERAFPGRLRYNRKPTRDDVVPVRVLQPGHPYFRGATRGGRAPVWWIENKSHPVEVRDRKRVTVLVDSPVFGKRYGEPAIVATFPWGRGRVVHLVSHIYLQRSQLGDPWTRRSAGAFAGDLGFPPESPVGRRLKEEGLADASRAGEVYSAYSIQRFLLNVVLEALRQSPPPPPPPPPPQERPDPMPGAPRMLVAAETTMRDAPEGRQVLTVHPGLRLVLVEEQKGWVRVRTPAGQEGWLRESEVTRR